MAQLNGVIGQDVRLLIVQFSYSNFQATPEGLLEKPEETAEEVNRRKVAVKGRPCLPATSDVDCLPFLNDLEKTSYVIVDGFKKVREKDRKPHQMVRFTFSRPDSATPSPEFLAQSGKVYAALEKLLEEALWRARGFVNPMFVKGGVADGESTISLNLEARHPIVSRKGRMILEQQEDGNGNRGGKGLVSSDIQLRIKSGVLCIIGA